MKLSKVLKGISYEIVKGNVEVEIDDICYDSRKVNDKSAFIALVGLNSDGHDYITQAISLGAKVIFVSKDTDIKEDVTVIKLSDTRKDLAFLSANLFENPMKEVITIGITGTKGKTTTAWMIKNILEEDGKRAGVIGTMGVFYNDVHYATVNTTPESYELNKYVREMCDNGIQYVIMEVSSQALKVGRVDGIIFDYGIFTNLTKDHIGIGEHATMDEYIFCKSLLFKKCRHGIFNIDDSNYGKMIENASCDIHTFGKDKADLIIENTRLFRDKNSIGIVINTSGIVSDKFKVNTPGMFSSYNASCAILTCILLNCKIGSIKTALEKVAVRGRVEIVPTGKNFTVIIDYAHNGVSLESILTTIREYNPKRIVSLFGCGGNRSRERRYDMGEISGRLSDLTIITEDNSRDEDVFAIMGDIEKGILKTSGEYVKIADRREAISYAINNALPEDIILILGKGHETYQEKNGVRTHFDDREEVMKVL